LFCLNVAALTVALQHLVCVPICKYTLTPSFDIICLLLYYVQMVKPQMRGNQMGVVGGGFGVGRYATINHTSGR
jgi:hypothetical protein